MAILTHVDALPAERVAYLKQAAQIRRSEGVDPKGPSFDSHQERGSHQEDQSL